MILVGLFGLGIGMWLSVDADEFRGVVLAQDQTSLRIYQSSGAVVVIPSIEGIGQGDIVVKRAGHPCCQVNGLGEDRVSAEVAAQLMERYELYWKRWSGTVEGFIMREHVDDADAALIRQSDGSLVQWKVWESHLAGLKRGEKLCKKAQSWSPQRCNPEVGVIEFSPTPPTQP